MLAGGCLRLLWPAAAARRPTAAACGPARRLAGLLDCRRLTAPPAGPVPEPSRLLGLTPLRWGRRDCSGPERRRWLVRDVRLTVAHENIYTVPNVLCVTRMALTPVIGWLVTCQLYPAALVCFAAAGATDLLDGWIARRFPSQASHLGSFLDPLADKLLVSTLFLSLTYTELIPLGLTLLIVARDLGLIAAASWVRYKSVPPPVTLSRYFDPTFATAQLEPTLISKVNTCLQISLVASTLAAPVFGFVDHTALRLMWCVTAGTTVASGMVYALLKSTTYKMMARDERS
ncbi:cardiolipin synthase (CMP-forming)-like [Pollicipes pollicipes]|uniref:cardiolipin synthase (CMP-forming)-like n=1 Tax=Pollicipes pollicipes TaxID=41117 RepID=UPI00188539EB|nr:cardiolipin synthase (CMP-forming)-like [Pollicipes pollicipes]